MRSAAALLFAAACLYPWLALAADPLPPDRQQPPLEQEQQAAGGSRILVVPSLDPYYTDLDVNIPLTDKPIPTITTDNELDRYRQLIKGSLIPRYMLLEASVYPMPVLGTYIKSHAPGLYRQGDVGHSGINIFESASAGFQEPYAFSIFFGNVARLARPNKKLVEDNMGYSGYLVSVGNRRIKDNVLIDDNWVELEWRIKGKLDYPDRKVDWSFRIGARNNSNPYVVDRVYFSIQRSNLDFHAPFLNWVANSDLDVKFYFSQHGGKVVREEYIVGKKYPVTRYGFSPTLDFGLIWDSPGSYTGPLQTRTVSTWTLVFRPSVEF